MSECKVIAHTGDALYIQRFERVPVKGELVEIGGGEITEVIGVAWKYDDHRPVLTVRPI